jgi:molybdopterin-containing oxidoreductase family iron-sulfur binding subunit
VITASNPVYGAPVDFKLGKLLERVPNSIYHALYEDETAAACKTIDPRGAPAGVVGRPARHRRHVSIVQPLIAPLWGGSRRPTCWPRSSARATSARTRC